jgi:protein-S-isoprenylcysteine O-methyltransferase Ste14
MKPVFLIPFIIFLTCLVIRTGYEILKKSGKVDSKNKLLFGFVFFAMCLLWISWFSMCPLDTAHFSLPLAIRWLGFGIFIIGMILAVGALIQLRGVENIDHLVTRGLFAKLGHPMYLGFILWIIGWGIYHDAVISLIVGMVGIGNIIYWRHLEEDHLVKTYGDEYITYRKQTWF